MSDHYNQLTDDDLEKIVDMTIDKMTKRAYEEVGKKVVSGLSWFFFAVGVVTISIYSILKSKGFIS